MNIFTNWQWYEVICFLIFYLLIPIVVFLFSQFTWNKIKNSKRKFKWIVEIKLKNSFLIEGKLKQKELDQGFIDGDEIKLIKSFCNHFKDLSEINYKYGFESKKFSRRLTVFLNGEDHKKDFSLRQFLVKWEKYNENEMKMSSSTKKDLFKDLVEIQKRTTTFIRSNKLK